MRNTCPVNFKAIKCLKNTSVLFVARGFYFSIPWGPGDA